MQDNVNLKLEDKSPGWKVCNELLRKKKGGNPKDIQLLMFLDVNGKLNAGKSRIPLEHGIFEKEGKED